MQHWCVRLAVMLCWFWTNSTECCGLSTALVKANNCCQSPKCLIFPSSLACMGFIEYFINSLATKWFYWPATLQHTVLSQHVIDWLHCKALLQCCYLSEIFTARCISDWNFKSVWPKTHIPSFSWSICSWLSGKPPLKIQPLASPLRRGVTFLDIKQGHWSTQAKLGHCAEGSMAQLTI